MSCPARRPMRVFLEPGKSCSTLLSLGLAILICTLAGCGGDGQNNLLDVPSAENTGANTGSNAGSIGAVASLAWDPVQDTAVFGYFVHYGRQSGGGSGNCPPGNSVFVSQPSATITNLENDTQYYFSVTSYNGAESPCSNEVTTVTSSAA